MSVRNNLFVVPVILLATGRALAQGAAQLPHFASTAELVSLNITATDQSRECFSRYPPYWNSGWDGCALRGLSKEVFEVFEDGVRQQIEIFQTVSVPIAVSLVIDTDLAIGQRSSDVHDAAIGLVRKLRPSDLAEVIGFDKGREIRQSFTNDLSLLVQVIRKMSGRYTASTDGSIDLLQRASESPQPTSPDVIRRHAIVFLTGGGARLATGSSTRLNFARRSQAAIYTIALIDRTPLDPSAELASSLRQLATVTGGRAFFPDDVRSLSSLYSQIYDEISQQYTIGYASTNARRDSRWRSVTVRVNRRNTSARTKQGYFAPSGP